MTTSPEEPSSSQLSSVPLDYASPRSRRITIGQLTLRLGGLSLLFAVWDVAAFHFEPMPTIVLHFIPLLGTLLLCSAGVVVGAIGWITRRKTDGDRCLLGVMLCIVAFVSSSFAVGRAASGFR